MGRGSNAPVPLNGPCETLMLILGAGGGLEGRGPGPVDWAALNHHTQSHKSFPSHLRAFPVLCEEMAEPTPGSGSAL